MSWSVGGERAPKIFGHRAGTADSDKACGTSRAAEGCKPVQSTDPSTLASFAVT